MRRLFFSLLAGFGATSVHLILMALKRSAGILPEFDPYEDLQRLLSAATAGGFQPPSWLLAYLNGALILGFAFGRLFAYLPGRTALARGAVFGLAAWLCLGFGLLPLAGRGLFAVNLNLGAWPALLMLAMLMIYSITMSLLYHWLMTSHSIEERPIS
jgi:hypothetical protein